MLHEIRDLLFLSACSVQDDAARRGEVRVEARERKEAPPQGPFCTSCPSSVLSQLGNIPVELHIETLREKPVYANAIQATWL